MNINNLFVIMKNRNISASKLSADTGISTGNISDWKSGRATPSASKLIVLADYLDCSVDYLLGRDKRNDNLESDEPGEDCSIDISLSEQEKIFLDKYQGLPDNLKLELVKTVNDFIDNFLKR